MLYSRSIGFTGYLKSSQILPSKLKSTLVAITVIQLCFNFKKDIVM